MPSRLVKAVHTGDIALARKKLEAGRNPNQLDEYKNPLIHYPIMQDDPEMLQLLLEYGADPNLHWKKTITVEKELTPLELAATLKPVDAGRRKLVIELLQAYGAVGKKSGSRKTRKASASAKKTAAPSRNNVIDQIFQTIMNRNQTPPMVQPPTSIQHRPNTNKVVSIKQTRKRTKKEQKVDVQKGNILNIE